MSNPTHVYVVNIESHDDYPAQGVHGVYTSQEAVERAYPEIKWVWEISDSDANLVGYEKGSSHNPYHVYYLPLDAVPDWESAWTKRHNRRKAAIKAWLRSKRITPEDVHWCPYEVGVSGEMGTAIVIFKGKKSKSKNNWSIKVSKNLERVNANLKPPEGFELAFIHESTTTEEQASIWNPAGTWRYIYLREIGELT